MKTLAERAKFARKKANLNQNTAAKKIGIKQPSLSDIETGKTKNLAASTLIGIAKAYKVNATWLETGKDEKKTIKEESALYNAEVMPAIKKSDQVPVIGMVQAGDWTEATDPYQIGEGQEHLPCPYQHGNNTFAVKVRGESMLDEFPEGIIIFIDPSQQAENKDYVIAKLEDTNEATFKQYVIEDGNKYLKAINPNWPTKYTHINGNCRIIGKLIGVYKKY